MFHNNDDLESKNLEKTTEDHNIGLVVFFAIWMPKRILCHSWVTCSILKGT